VSARRGRSRFPAVSGLDRRIRKEHNHDSVFTRFGAAARSYSFVSLHSAAWGIINRCYGRRHLSRSCKEEFFEKPGIEKLPKGIVLQTKKYK